MQDQQDHTNELDLIDEMAAKDEAYHAAEIEFHKHRKPLYAIVVVAFIIALLNSLYIGSGTVFLMCLLFGGGVLTYLYSTRHNIPDLPKTGDRIYDPSDKKND